MSRKWRIVFALVTVAAVACAILFFLPKELSAIISPGADEFSISSAIVEVSGEMSADAVTITDAAALNGLAQAIRTAKVTMLAHTAPSHWEGSPYTAFIQPTQVRTGSALSAWTTTGMCIRRGRNTGLPPATAMRSSHFLRCILAPGAAHPESSSK